MQTLRRLAHPLPCSHPVRLLESAEVPSAAVMGWMRPLIVLPVDWPTWKPAQLQAVLAHEMAHVRRRDFFWRSLATMTRALHYYHPLAHWLLRRLAYSQEVAADQLAAKMIASRAAYCKALSQLAIRQDDKFGFRAEPSVLPTLSSHLIRRIKMLRAKECVECGGIYMAFRIGTGCLVVFLGVTTIALRGLAQPLTPEAAHQTVQLDDQDDLVRGLFHRSPSRPLIDEDNEDGVFVVKVAKILKQKSLQPYLPLIDRAVSEGWKKLFSTTESPIIDLDAIEYITGLSQIKVKRLAADAEAEHRNQVMVGSPYGIVRFKNAISTWQEWVQLHVPNTIEL